MKRTIIQSIMGWVAVMLLFASCRNDEPIIQPEREDVPEGYVAIHFQTNQSGMREVNVRSVDPDGQDIHQMNLFCFNAYGLFLAAVEATLSPDAAQDGGHSVSGSYTANIPEETSIIHFIANQNAALYADKNFINQTEAQVLGAMEGGSGMMIYWARCEKAAETDWNTQLEEKPIELIRNQAKVTIKDWNNENHTVVGYVVTNIHAFGTVAPFCHTHGFAIYNWPVSDGHYSVTLPEDKTMMSDIDDINTKSEDYIFEHENTLDNPVSVIIKDANNMYYRAMIMDNETGNMVPILRNHHYELEITGPLSYGKPSFEEALNGPATNNVWVSVDKWVKEVADKDYKLTLKETSKVFHADKAHTAYSFEYTLTNADGSVTDITQADVSWLDGNNVAYHDFVPTFDETTGKGHISITLLADDPNTQEQTGTLMIRKGFLYRTIDISMISTQKFTPAWIAAQVFGESVGEHVTLKFTIPETCPESLFPFPVMVTVHDLDVRAASGQKLPVRLENEASWYGEHEAEYKYEYMVDRPGVHRLYFHNILPHNEEGNTTETVTIEANFFETLTKTVLFVDHKRTITVDGLREYDENKPDWAETDKPIKYLLVPQKKNAFVEFDLHLEDLELTTEDKYVNAGTNDEFLIYSQVLNYYTGTGTTVNDQSITFDCEFGGVNENIWSVTDNGRVAAFRPRTRGTDPAQGTGKYNIYMYTNKPVSEDVIRIASNVTGSKAYWNTDGTVNTDDAVTYQGNTYRSTIFELTNYRPFRFAAQVKDKDTYKGTYKSSSVTDEEEDEEEICWDYAAAGQPIDVSFDVTSFQSATTNESVDPFGTAFEIYIDAPMLEIDATRLAENKLDVTKLRADSENEGRFIYTVDANRESERAFGTDGVKNQDATSGANQAGERKTLPFKTKDITSAGEIRISSDKNTVVFYDKTFKVKNSPIEGTIQYKTTDGQENNVPENAFVAFIRNETNSRIGVMTIGKDGKYKLNLRSEYEFGWLESITLDYKHTDDNGVSTYYECQTSLSNLSVNPSILLVEVQD